MSRAKRPRDTNQPVKLVVDVAAGEHNDPLTSDPVNEFARAGGLKDGKAQAERLSAEKKA